MQRTSCLQNRLVQDHPTVYPFHQTHTIVPELLRLYAVQFLRILNPHHCRLLCYTDLKSSFFSLSMCLIQREVCTNMSSLFPWEEVSESSDYCSRKSDRTEIDDLVAFSCCWDTFVRLVCIKKIVCNIICDRLLLCTHACRKRHLGGPTNDNIKKFENVKNNSNFFEIIHFKKKQE